MRDFLRVLTIGIALALAGGPLAAQSNRDRPDLPDLFERPDIDTRDARIPSVLRAPGGLFENIAIGPVSDLPAVLALVAETGGTVIRQTDLPALGQFSLIATFPSQPQRDRFAAALREQLPATGLSVHWNYFLAQSAPRLYAPALIGDPEPGRCRLARPVRIGMIDGPVDPAHPALRGARVRHVSLVPGAPVPSADHGTGVAALMVGEDPSGALAGFARGAELSAVSIFTRTEQGEETSVELIVAALDRLVGEGVQVVNMSFAGPDSNAMRRSLAVAAGRRVVLVAAAGNNRAQAVAYPAAVPEVIAVTAVDGGRRRFRQANVGPETEFSAPGVDLYVARARGAGYASGTSFATPIVTALVARQIAAGTAGVEPVRASLRAGVQPLGTGPRNAEFGWGLVRGGC